MTPLGPNTPNAWDARQGNKQQGEETALWPPLGHPTGRVGWEFESRFGSYCSQNGDMYKHTMVAMRSGDEDMIVYNRPSL